MQSIILDVQGVKKVYTTRLGGAPVKALCGVSFSVREGEFVAIMGESGSGKTTLLNILAGLDKPMGGQVLLAGQDMADVPEREMVSFRREQLGFVFQEFNLLDTFTLRDNILLPLVLSGMRYIDMQPRLQRPAARLNIAALLDKYPYEVSGGQKQRAAAARALITSPRLILADEPTGALDSRSSEELLSLFESIHESGQTLLMVTHSIRAACYVSRMLFIKDGVIFHQLYRGDAGREEMYQKISDTLTLLTTGGERR